MGLLPALVGAAGLAAGSLAFAQTATKIRARMTEVALTPAGTSHEQIDAFIKVEMAKWARVVKVSGAKAD